MNDLMKRIGAGAGATVLVAAMGLVGAVTPALADTAAGVTGDATFSWAVNEESGGGAYYGGCNFLVAGEVGDVHGSQGRGSSVWTNEDGKNFYTADEGNTTITKGDSDTPTWDTKCEDANGRSVSTGKGSSTWNQVNISSGTGTVDPNTNSADVQWDGAFTLVYYGGMTYWTVKDPKIRVDGGEGEITATLSGYGADMHDPSKWVELEDKRNAVIADLSDVSVTADGIEATPAYAGVEIEVEAGGPSGAQNREGTGWGSFPQDWIDFNVETGQAAYWYTSGGLVDAKKTAVPITIDYTTDALAFLDPGALPKEPENLEAAEDSHDASTISWKRPEGAKDEGSDDQNGKYPPAYQAQWTEGERTEENPGSEDWTGRTVNGAVTSTVVDGLAPDTTYTARVRSMNHAGDESDDSYSLSSDWEYVTFTTTEHREPSPAPTPEPPDGDDDRDGDRGGSDDSANSGDGAVFRWAMNREAGSGAYFGGCNFLSAGISGDYGSSQVWVDDSLYSSSDGNTTIRKATADGGWSEADWSTKCQDRYGTTLSTNGKDQWSEQQVVITGGDREQLDDGGERIEWDGGFTVVFYGGLTYWWAEDPVLEVDGSGDGTVTATAGGYGASMYDASQWAALEERTITLANVSGVDTDGADSEGGFTVTPEYLGVTYSGTGGEEDSGHSRVGGEEGNPTVQTPKTSGNEGYWGSFPSDFIDFQDETGQFSYWLTSGGARDPYKPTEPLTVAFSDDYDSGPGGYSGEGGGSSAAAGPGGGSPGGGPGSGGGAAANAGDSGGGSGAPDAGPDPAAADFDEDRSAFSEMAQQASGDSSLPTRAIVIGGITAGAGLAATITSVVYFRRRLGLDPRMFV